MKLNSETESPASFRNELLRRLFRESKVFRRIVITAILSLGVLGTSCAPQVDLPPPNATMNEDYSEVISIYWKTIEQAYVNRFGQKKANEMMDQLWRKIASFSSRAQARFLRKFAQQLISDDQTLILMPSPESFCISFELTTDGDPELEEMSKTLELFYCPAIEQQQ